MVRQIRAVRTILRGRAGFTPEFAGLMCIVVLGSLDRLFLEF
jgi:hypothetical protein